MKKPDYHLFLCNSFRINGEPQGACHRKESPRLLQYLQGEIGDRGLDDIVSTTSCLNVCEKGPVLIIYPHGWWYAEVTEDKIDVILDALEDGTAAESLRMV